MFNFKKQHKKEKSLIEQRIEALDDKLSYISSHGNSLYVKIMTSCFRPHEEIGYQTFMETKYGIRELFVSSCKLIYSKPKKDGILNANKHYDLIWCDSKILFEITIKDGVKVSPNPMIKFTAEEMDLAILEFENHIESYYKEAQNKVANHNNIIKYLTYGG